MKTSPARKALRDAHRTAAAVAGEMSLALSEKRARLSSRRIGDWSERLAAAKFELDRAAIIILKS